ncbi:MAG TPA: hypothetical protein VKA68_18530 [bacterium]|nr:hypothetical protein [bacterium]
MEGILFYQVHASSAVSHAFKPVVRDCWPEDPRRDKYRFHDLRYTFATNYLRRGG